MEVGDKVRVTGSKSLPVGFMGKIGEVTGFIGGKAIVLFIPREGDKGSLSHTAIVDDLEIVEE